MNLKDTEFEIDHIYYRDPVYNRCDVEEYTIDFRDWCDMWSEKDACVDEKRYKYFQDKYGLYYSNDYVINGYDKILGVLDNE